MSAGGWSAGGPVESLRVGSERAAGHEAGGAPRPQESTSVTSKEYREAR